MCFRWLQVSINHDQSNHSFYFYSIVEKKFSAEASDEDEAKFKATMQSACLWSRADLTSFETVNFELDDKPGSVRPKWKGETRRRRSCSQKIRHNTTRELAKRLTSDHVLMRLKATGKVGRWVPHVLSERNIAAQHLSFTATCYRKVFCGCVLPGARHE